MISKMTKNQEQQIQVYLDKWLNLGRRTVSIDKEKSKNAVNFLYEKILRKDKPKYYIFLDSPMACNLAMNLLKDSKFKTDKGSQLGSQLYSQLRSQLDSQLGSQLRSQLDSQLYSQLGSQLRSQLDSQLDSQLRSQLDSQLRSQLYSQLGSQLGSQLDSQLDSQLYSQLGSQLGSQLDSQLRSQLDSHYYCPTINNLDWSNYYGFYDFVLNELMPDKIQSLALFVEFLPHYKEIHMIYMFDNIVFISDFPKEININERGQLHSLSQAALLYRDTYSIYALNGIRMDKELAIANPKDITKDIILKQKNADIRRELVRKLTPEQLITVLDAKILDTYNDYQLLGVDLGDNRVRPFLKMNNPSMPGVVHVEGVHPTCQTVKDAIQFRNGLESFSEPVDLT